MLTERKNGESRQGLKHLFSIVFCIFPKLSRAVKKFLKERMLGLQELDHSYNFKGLTKTNVILRLFYSTSGVSDNIWCKYLFLINNLSQRPGPLT